MTFLGELIALTVAFFWAISSLIWNRVGANLRSSELNITRGLIAMGLVAATIVVRGERLAGYTLPAMGMLMLSGTLGIAVGDTAYFESLKCIGVRRSTLVKVLSPPMAALIALAFLGEQLSLRAWGGIALTAVGVAWVLTERLPDSPAAPADGARGVAFGLVSALADAGGAVISRGVLVETGISPLWSVLVRWVGALTVLAVWLRLGRQPNNPLSLPGSRRTLGLIAVAVFFGSYLGIWLQQISLQMTAAGIAQTVTVQSLVKLASIHKL